MGTDKPSPWKYGDFSEISYIILPSVDLKFSGDMGPYQQNNWGHSWIYCAKSPHFQALE